MPDWDLRLFRFKQYAAITDMPGLVANLDADAITGVANLAALATWPDPIIGGATQATVANRPQYLTNGYTDANAVVHAGVEFASASSQYMDTVGSVGPGPGTVVVLAIPKIDPTTEQVIATTYESGNGLGVAVGAPPNDFLGFNGTPAGGGGRLTVDSGYASASNAIHCVVVSGDGANLSVSVDGGAPVVTASTAEFSIGSGIRLGATNSFGTPIEFADVIILKVIVFSRVLSSTDRKLVEYLLCQEYALTWGPAAQPRNGTYKRITFPNDNISKVTIEDSEKGGFLNGAVELLIPWDQYNLLGGELCDIRVKNQLRFRGHVLLPEKRVRAADERTLNLFGPLVKARGARVKQRYAYATPQDLSVFATRLFNEVLAPFWEGEEILVSNVLTVGVQVKTFDAYDKSFSEALAHLVAISPGSCVWGFDTARVNGVDTTRFNFYQRATAIVPAPKPKYAFHIGTNVAGVVVPLDSSSVVNKIHIVGGPYQFPNQLHNGSFENPAVPDEQHGNMLRDYSFETDHEGRSTSWTLLNDASVKSVNDTGGSLPGARTGASWVALDQNTEEIQQIVDVDRTRAYFASAWVRRGAVLSAARFTFVVEGLNASNVVQETITLYTSQDPTLMSNYDGDPTNYQYASGAVNFTHASTVRARFRLWSLDGTNTGDGIDTDDEAFYETGQAAQDGWVLRNSSFDIVPAQQAYCPFPAIYDTQHTVVSPGDSTEPLHGGACIKIQAAAGATGYFVELRSEEWARVQLQPWRTYAFSCYVRCPKGQLFSVSLGVDQFDQNGFLTARYESPTLQPAANDGAWYPATYSFPTGTAQSSAEVFIRVRSTVPVYIDGAMLILGVVQQAEILQDLNYWEGQNYERTYDVTSPDLASGLTAAAKASITSYGLQEARVDEPLIVDKLTAQAYAIGELNTTAVAKTLGQLDLEDYDGKVGFDGLVTVIGLPDWQGPLGVAKTTTVLADGISLTVDMDNERPNLALLIAAKDAHDLLVKQLATTNSAGAVSPGTGPGSGSGFGTPPDATTTAKGIIELAGDLTGTAAAPALAASGVTAGAYGDSTHIPAITVDAKGRVTAVSVDAIPPASLSTATASKTTASLASGATESGSMTAWRVASILQVTTDRPAWVRLYGTSAFRDADVARPINTDPTGEHGVLLDLLTAAGTLAFDLAPIITAANADATTASTLYYNITNKDAGAATVTATLSALVLEA